MTLADLLQLKSFEYKSRKVKLVRHSPSDNDEEVIRLGYFDFFQAGQGRDVFDCEAIISFLKLPRGNAILKGTYNVLGKRAETPEDIPEVVAPYLPAKTGRIRYDLHPTNELDDLCERLVIDWGGSQNWVQHAYKQASKKEVIQILPRGYLRPFPGYFGISLTYNELLYLVQHPDANSDWKHALARTAGVYLILDEIDGGQYVGSAGGASGIWGRWKFYAQNPSGNNELLKKLLKSAPDRYRHFRYSLIDILPVNTPPAELIGRENLAKMKLGSRAFGLNSN